MTKKQIYGPNPLQELTYLELPIGASTIGFDPNLLKTGTWRFIRPVIRTLTAPCQEACPAGVDARGFIRLVKEGRLDEALALYLDENPFPAICGRVCFHPCEAACNRGSFDESISINALENYIGDRRSPEMARRKDSGKKVAIVGSGPAGLACAYYLRRLGYAVTIFEKEAAAGGILRYGIPEYRLPKKVLDREISRLKTMGVKIETGHEFGKNLGYQDLGKYNASFIATGAGVATGLKIPGTTAEGVYSGLEFLQKVATGEIKTFKKKVAVIGGGNTAVDAARTVRRLGGKAAIYYRRSREEIPATTDEIEGALEEKVELNYLTSPVGILTAKGKVAGVELVINKLGKPDETNRPKPVVVKGSNYEVKCDVVILAVGEAAELGPLSGVLRMENQIISINGLGQTSRAATFAGGDMTDYQRTVTFAIRSGKRAALGIDCLLNSLNDRQSLERLEAVTIGGKGALSFRKYYYNDFSTGEEARQVVGYEDLNTSYFRHLKRKERPKLAAAERVGGFMSVMKGLSAANAAREAQRCFSCGLCNTCGNCFIFCPDSSVYFDDKQLVSLINYDYCKGCGICAEECPRGAIVMLKEE